LQPELVGGLRPRPVGGVTAHRPVMMRIMRVQEVRWRSLNFRHNVLQRVGEELQSQS
jgi:hypothetical protein